MSINHIATNLVTKGLLNISDITKGFIIIGYEIVPPPHFKGKRGGSSPFISETDFYESIKKYEDVDVIKVRIDWKKKYKGNKLIEAKLIKSHIETRILEETGKKINVELI
jgi:hypothetical protein